MTSKNFMGDSEPFMWGYFDLKRTSRSTSYFVFEADIHDTMFHLRRSKATIVSAFKMARFIIRYLLPNHPDDELLACLYWNMKLLTIPAVPAEAAEWRFFWLWLIQWGLAPELFAFYGSKGFNDAEVFLLSQIEVLTPKRVAQLFSTVLDPTIRENVFKVASKLAVAFLDQV